MSDESLVSMGPWQIDKAPNSWQILDGEGAMICRVFREPDAEVIRAAPEAMDTVNMLQYRLARHRDRLDEGDQQALAEAQTVLKRAGYNALTVGLDEYVVDEIERIEVGHMNTPGRRLTE